MFRFLCTCVLLSFYIFSPKAFPKVPDTKAHYCAELFDRELEQVHGTRALNYLSELLEFQRQRLEDEPNPSAEPIYSYGNTQSDDFYRMGRSSDRLAWLLASHQSKDSTSTKTRTYLDNSWETFMEPAWHRTQGSSGTFGSDFEPDAYRGRLRKAWLLASPLVVGGATLLGTAFGFTLGIMGALGSDMHRSDPNNQAMDIFALTSIMGAIAGFGAGVLAVVTNRYSEKQTHSFLAFYDKIRQFSWQDLATEQTVFAHWGANLGDESNPQQKTVDLVYIAGEPFEAPALILVGRTSK